MSSNSQLAVTRKLGSQSAAATDRLGCSATKIPAKEYHCSSSNSRGPEALRSRCSLCWPLLGGGQLQLLMLVKERKTLLSSSMQCLQVMAGCSLACAKATAWQRIAGASEVSNVTDYPVKMLCSACMWLMLWGCCCRPFAQHACGSCCGVAAAVHLLSMHVAHAVGLLLPSICSACMWRMLWGCCCRRFAQHACGSCRGVAAAVHLLSMHVAHAVGLLLPSICSACMWLMPWGCCCRPFAQHACGSCCVLAAAGTVDALLCCRAAQDNIHRMFSEIAR